MNGAWQVARSFDTAGAMAKSVLDLAQISDILLHPVTGLKSALTDAITAEWDGISVGFVDVEKWRLPPSAQPYSKEYNEQTVSSQTQT